MRSTKQAKMTDYIVKFGHLSRQQYIIVFNQIRWARQSLMPSEKTNVFLIFFS